VRDEINSRTEPLQRQGTHFLDEVRQRVGPSLRAETGSPSSAQKRLPESVQWSPEESDAAGQTDLSPDVIESFVAAFLAYASTRDSDQVDTALRCRGALAFVSRIGTVRDTYGAANPE